MGAIVKLAPEKHASAPRWIALQQLIVTVKKELDNYGPSLKYNKLFYNTIPIKFCIKKIFLVHRD